MGDLLDAFEVSAKAGPEIVAKVDDALLQAGRTIAGQIDFAVENLSGQDVTKALYLMPHLVNILREMKATPAARSVEAKAPTANQKKSALASVSNIPRPA